MRRTRAALLDALLALMGEKGYDAVTVQDLIDRADIGRATFYAHYSDKADLLDETLAQLQSFVSLPADTRAPDRRHPLPFSLHLFRHVHDQGHLLTALLSRSGSGTVITRIEQMLREIVTAELTTLLPEASTARVPVDLLARSVVASCLVVLTWWVETGCEQSPEELEAMFRVLTTPAVRAALPTAS